LALPAAASSRQAAPGSDAPFDAALPPLEATTPPPTAPTTTPPAVPDTDITKPLVPLSQFDATPPPATAKEVAADTTVRIRYTTQITGLKGVRTDAPEGDLERQFRALSALIKDGKKAANAAQVQARANEDVQLAQRIMHAAGYYDGIATAQ
jgi:translocation and assembly module TamA